MKGGDEEREARRIIERVGAETEARMRPGQAKRADGKDRAETDEEDWAEFWGKRIGRVFSFVLFFVAVYWIWQYLSGQQQ